MHFLLWSSIYSITFRMNCKHFVRCLSYVHHSSSARLWIWTKLIRQRLKRKEKSIEKTVRIGGRGLNDINTGLRIFSSQGESKVTKVRSQSTAEGWGILGFWWRGNVVVQDSECFEIQYDIRGTISICEKYIPLVCEGCAWMICRNNAGGLQRRWYAET